MKKIIFLKLGVLMTKVTGILVLFCVFPVMGIALGVYFSNADDRLFRSLMASLVYFLPSFPLTHFCQGKILTYIREAKEQYIRDENLFFLKMYLYLQSIFIALTVPFICFLLGNHLMGLDMISLVHMAIGVGLIPYYICLIKIHILEELN